MDGRRGGGRGRGRGRGRGGTEGPRERSGDPEYLNKNFYEQHVRGNIRPGKKRNHVLKLKKTQKGYSVRVSGHPKGSRIDGIYVGQTKALIKYVKYEENGELNYGETDTACFLATVKKVGDKIYLEHLDGPLTEVGSGRYMDASEALYSESTSEGDIEWYIDSSEMDVEMSDDEDDEDEDEDNESSTDDERDQEQGGAGGTGGAGGGVSSDEDDSFRSVKTNVYSCDSDDFQDYSIGGGGGNSGAGAAAAIVTGAVGGILALGLTLLGKK